MPMGKGTYGSQKGRPPKKKVSKGPAALKKTAAVLTKNRRKR